MTLTSRSGNWPPPRCTGRKHSGFSKSEPFTKPARVSEQGGSAAHLLLRGSDQETIPFVGTSAWPDGNYSPDGKITRLEEPLPHHEELLRDKRTPTLMGRSLHGPFSPVPWSSRISLGCWGWDRGCSFSANEPR